MKNTNFTSKLASIVLISTMMLAFVGCCDDSPTTASESDFEVKLTQDGKSLKITKYKGVAKHLVIPDTIQGLPVVAIGMFYGMGNFDGLFSSNYVARQKLESVVIPEGVRIIGSNAFDHCTNLTSVTLPKSLRVIMPRAFYECENLSNIELPNSIEVLGEEVFTASGLTSVTIPESLKYIGRHTFASCHKLTEVNVANDWSSHIIVKGELSDGIDLTQVFSGDKIRVSDAVREMLKSHKFKNVAPEDSAMFKDLLISVNY